MVKDNNHIIMCWPLITCFRMRVSINRKFVIYIAILAVLLIALYYRASVYYRISPKVKSAKMASPYVDDRIEGQIKDIIKG